MEDDRLESSLTHDVKQSVEEDMPLRQPKNRFVGRRRAAENSRLGGGSPTIEDNGAIQCISSPPHLQINSLTSLSIPDSQDPKNLKSSPA